MRFGIHLNCLCGGEPDGPPLAEQGTERAAVITYRCGGCGKTLALQLTLRPVPTVTDLHRDGGHGTDNRYKQHYRDGETPCQQCIDGHALANSERKERRSQPLELIG